MEENCTDSVITKQLSGKKKKRLFTKINEQMEFYFSDSNLVKDKFLQNLIEQNPEGYVELEVFKTFNKLKQLTDDIDIITAAVTKSNILEVKGNKIRRVTPIGTSKDFDACTLYVEKLPPYVDHKWVKDVFEHFGSVDHVNIPRFKVSKKIKGFAFVEFSCPDGVMKACEHYKKSAAKTTAESEGEESSSKKGKTRKSNQGSDSEEKSSKKRKSVSDVAEPLSKKICSNVDIKSSIKDQVTNSDTEKEMPTQKSSKKRKLESNESDIPLKKAKESEFQTSDEDNVHLAPEKTPVQSEEGAVSDSADETKEKSKRKRKHKKKKSDHSERPPLRVMSKYEWKAYRNRYLALQRSTMSHIKLQIMAQTQELKEMEFCGKPEAASEPPKKGIQFQSGVILKVTLNDPIENCTEIKDKVKANAAVAYIDAPLGHTELFIRCHNPEEAHTIIEQKKLQDIGSVKLLQGADEEGYWKKIEDERKAKFSVPLSHKKRGRDKIIAKAAKLAEQKNKHIYFDE